jgi:uncharacterized membrane protein
MTDIRSPMAGPTKTDTGLHQNLAAALAYALGLVGGLIFLAVEKENRYVRFHAMQSVVTFGLAGVVYLIVGALPVVGRPLGVIFIVVTVGLWAFLMFKAVNGDRYRLPFVGEWAESHLK